MKLLMIIYSVFLATIDAQVLKFKKDTSCSTKMASKLRRNSILIVSKISANQKNVATLQDCFMGCPTHENCAMFAYRETEKGCLFFKEILANEVLSRLIFEGWKPGRINPQQKIISYVSDVCNGEEYCQDSCLSGVKEACTPSEYKLPECTEYDGFFNGCDHAKEFISDNPSLGLSSVASGFSHSQTYSLKIEGTLVTASCPEHVEYTKIKSEDGRCMATPSYDGYGFYRNQDCMKTWYIFAYNRITHDLTTHTTQRYLKLTEYYYFEGKHYTSEHFMPTDSLTEKLTFERTGFGTYQINDGRYVMQELHRPNIQVFYQTLHPSDKPFGVYGDDYNSFSNIPGAVKASLYQAYTGNLDSMRTLTPSKTGRYDNFKSFNFRNGLGEYGIILQTYFVAPSDGLYRFILVSDDSAKLYMSSNDQESAKYEIIYNPEAVLGLTDFSKQSNEIQLTSGTKYYMEIIGVELSRNDYFIAGVILPNGDQIVPITYQYLKPYY